MKKGESSVKYVVFVVLFIAIMGIINSYFNVESLVENKQDQEDETFWTWVKGLFSGFSNLIENIPIIGGFWSFVNTSFQFIYVHEYLSIILVALVGIPFGYIALRLVRGGG